MTESDRLHAVDRVLERERWWRKRRAEERNQEPMRRAMFIGAAFGLVLGVLLGQLLWSNAFLAPSFAAVGGLALGVAGGACLALAREHAVERAREAEEAKAREEERFRRREEARKRRKLPRAAPKPPTPNATPNAERPENLSVEQSSDDDFIVPPNFYPDPDGSGRRRWWDGAVWTDRYADAGDNGEPLPRSARRVAKALQEQGHEGEVRILDDSARTAAEAAAMLGVEQRQIVKSLVFRGSDSGRPVLALVNGDARVSTALLEAALGEPVERPDGDWVKKRVGFAIGGVPPLGHATEVRVVADPALIELSELWAAAGTPHAVFRFAGEELVDLTGAELEPIAAPPGA